MEISLDSPLIAALAVGIGLLAAGPALGFVLRRRHRTSIAADIRRLRAPVRAFALALVATVHGTSADLSWLRVLGRLGLIVSITWALLRALWIVQQVWYRRLRVDVDDNRVARSRRTRIDLLRRVAGAMLVVCATAVALLTLAPFRSFGPTVVAYGGLIAAVLGLALRSPLENFAAGMMIAFSEAVRLDDVVVVDGEWGKVQHIGLTNVIVRIWDDRTLVIPTSRLASESFENWTHQASDLLGAVTLWVDYGTDLDRLRDEVDRVLATLPDWDGRASAVQVVELGAHAVQVRVLATARDAQSCWDLRCELREQLLDFLRSQPGGLPVLRLSSGDPVASI